MNSDPITPANGNPLAQKNRPNLENLSKDTTESDLWALDDLDLNPNGRAGFRTGANLPLFQTDQKSEANKGNDPAEGAPPPASEPPAIVEKFRPSGSPAKAAFLDRSSPVNDILDLGVLDESQPAVIVMPAPEKELRTATQPEIAPPGEKKSSAIKNFQDELKESQKSGSKNIPRKNKIFSTMEWIGLAAIFVLLTSIGAFAFMKSIAQLPTNSIYDHDLKFPIKGQHLNLTGATSYWRAPNTNGASNESVRDRTVLIPVLELASSTGPAAIRVIYRDENAKIIGDILSRTVVSGEKLIIPATAGFEDRGKHAAYRIGQAKPWMIEILEAAPGKSSTTEFKKLIEFPVSTELR